MARVKTNSILMEIRAGAGGEEAGLFANDLFRMYTKYATSQEWKVKVLDSNTTELGGVKSISFKIKGKGAYSEMKYEAGVHRVQRVPETEKGNRIHTSTASVVVLPIPTATEINLKDSDIEMNFFKASGPGGQYVNKRQTAVRLTHKPTGVTVSSQESRSLESNKKSALSMLKAKLYEREQAKKIGKMEERRKAQIGESERAEKIRTYNFPQDRITDHRINKKWHKIDETLDGDLGKIIKKLKKNLS